MWAALVLLALYETKIHRTHVISRIGRRTQAISSERIKKFNRIFPFSVFWIGKNEAITFICHIFESNATLVSLYLFSGSFANRMSKLLAAVISNQNTTKLFNWNPTFRLRRQSANVLQFPYQSQHENRTVFIVFASGIGYILCVKILGWFSDRIKEICISQTNSTIFFIGHRVFDRRFDHVYFWAFCVGTWKDYLCANAISHDKFFSIYPFH